MRDQMVERYLIRRSAWRVPRRRNRRRGTAANWMLYRAMMVIITCVVLLTMLLATVGVWIDLPPG
jgi:hypothetical protein